MKLELKEWVFYRQKLVMIVACSSDLVDQISPHENLTILSLPCLSHAILLCDIIEQFTSVEQHIGGLLTAVPPLVSACEEFLSLSHDINNK